MIDSQLLFNKKVSITNEIDKFIIKKDDGAVYALDKQTYNITTVSDSTSTNKPEQFYSIVGVLDTKSNAYLVCVNNAEFIGNIITSRVFKITEVSLGLILSLCTFHSQPDKSMIRDI
jgi:hypothetical protein